MIRPWRFKGAPGGDVSCCVCGRRAFGGLCVMASPVTGDFCDRTVPEASFYPIGSDCAQKVKAERPALEFIRFG